MQASITRERHRCKVQLLIYPHVPIRADFEGLCTQHRVLSSAASFHAVCGEHTAHTFMRKYGWWLKHQGTCADTLYKFLTSAPKSLNDTIGPSPMVVLVLGTMGIQVFGCTIPLHIPSRTRGRTGWQRLSCAQRGTRDTCATMVLRPPLACPRSLPRKHCDRRHPLRLPLLGCQPRHHSRSAVEFWTASTRSW